MIYDFIDFNIIYIYCFNHYVQSQGYYLDSKTDKIMTCNCKNHLEQFTCSGVGCQVCVLGEENYIENPKLPEERYCLKCAMKKAGFTMEELWQLMMANPDNSFQCGDKSH